MDDTIIKLIQAGRSEEAFEHLVPAYRRRVFGLAFSVLRHRAAAEDLAQEVFVKLWQALDRYDGSAKLSTWVYAITRNAAISALRKERPTDSISDPTVMHEVESRGPDHTRDGSGDAALWQQVEALPSKQRQAVTLFYQEDRTVEEVAEMMGIPANTVKTHLHRARASLALALGPDAREAAA